MSKRNFFKLKGIGDISVLPNPKLGPFIGCFIFVFISICYFHLWPLLILILIFKFEFVYYIQDSFFTLYSFLSIGIFLILLPPCFQTATFQTDSMRSKYKTFDRKSLSRITLVYLVFVLFIVPLIISLLLHPPIWNGANELSHNYKNLQQKLDFYLYRNNITFIGLVGPISFLSAYYFSYVVWFFALIPIKFTLYLQLVFWKIKSNEWEE